MQQELLRLESEAGFKALFEFASISILVIGPDGKIELANPHAEELFGYHPNELIGKAVEILIPESYRENHQHYRKQYFHRPTARPMGLGLDLHARKKDDTIFPVEISLGHYELAGEPLAVAFVTDISERKNAEEKLHKLNDELEMRVKERTEELADALEREKEMNEMKSRFVSIASHEFRTPLSTILSSVSLIEKYTESDQQAKRESHVNRIKRSIKSLIDILNDFLSLDKLEQKNVKIENDSFDITQFTNDISLELEGMLKKGQIIRLHHEGESQISIDKKIARNIILNLLSNAIKYSNEDQPIDLRTFINPNHIIIEVEDKGIGIPPEEQDKIFSRFFRAKNTGNIQGTGLGLSIVSRYVQLLEGKISFKSSKSNGTIFTIEIPR